MADEQNKKMINMMILEILKKYSDEEHKLTQEMVMKHLKDDYGIKCDRKTITNNINYLNNFEDDCHRKPYDITTKKGYALLSRDFSEGELRMLIDSVLYSKNISQKQAKSLIDKLLQFQSKYFGKKVAHISNIAKLEYVDNGTLYGVDFVNEAIAKNKKISFIYNQYGTDFKLHPKREERYIVSPYQMVTCNGYYYLVANYDKYNDITHFRLDRMSDVVILENEPAKPKSMVADFEKGYSLPKYKAEHIYMYSGDSVRVKFLAPANMMNELVDWFGKGFRIRETDKDDVIEVTLECNETAMQYWALQYGLYVEVLEPASLRSKIKDAINEMNKKYEG